LQTTRKHSSQLGFSLDLARVAYMRFPVVC
jgi:hypothetical protein